MAQNEHTTPSKSLYEINAERFLWVTTSMTGLPVQTIMKNKSKVDGHFHSFDATSKQLPKEFCLRNAQKIASGDSLSGEIQPYLIVPWNDIACISGLKIPISYTNDELDKDRKLYGIKSEANLHKEKHSPQPHRQLKKWQSDQTGVTHEALEDSSQTPTSWDQFQANEMLFGVTTTFDESIYTTPLDINNISESDKAKATQQAEEIMKKSREQGNLSGSDHEGDEEEMFSAVKRPQVNTKQSENENIKKKNNTLQNRPTKGKDQSSNTGGHFSAAEATKPTTFTNQSSILSNGRQNDNLINVLSLEPPHPRVSADGSQQKIDVGNKIQDSSNTINKKILKNDFATFSKTLDPMLEKGKSDGLFPSTLSSSISTSISSQGKQSMPHATSPSQSTSSIPSSRIANSPTTHQSSSSHYPHSTTYPSTTYYSHTPPPPQTTSTTTHTSSSIYPHNVVGPISPTSTTAHTPGMHVPTGSMGPAAPIQAGLVPQPTGVHAPAPIGSLPISTSNNQTGGIRPLASTIPRTSSFPSGIGNASTVSNKVNSQSVASTQTVTTTKVSSGSSSTFNKANTTSQEDASSSANTSTPQKTTFQFNPNAASFNPSSLGGVSTTPLPTGGTVTNAPSSSGLIYTPQGLSSSSSGISQLSSMTTLEGGSPPAQITSSSTNYQPSPPPSFGQQHQSQTTTSALVSSNTVTSLIGPSGTTGNTGSNMIDSRNANATSSSTPSLPSHLVSSTQHHSHIGIAPPPLSSTPSNLQSPPPTPPFYTANTSTQAADTKATPISSPSQHPSSSASTNQQQQPTTNQHATTPPSSVAFSNMLPPPQNTSLIATTPSTGIIPTPQTALSAIGVHPTMASGQPMPHPSYPQHPAGTPFFAHASHQQQPILIYPHNIPYPNDQTQQAQASPLIMHELTPYPPSALQLQPSNTPHTFFPYPHMQTDPYASSISIPPVQYIDPNMMGMYMQSNISPQESSQNFGKFLVRNRVNKDKLKFVLSDLHEKVKESSKHPQTTSKWKNVGDKDIIQQLDETLKTTHDDLNTSFTPTIQWDFSEPVAGIHMNAGGAMPSYYVSPPSAFMTANNPGGIPFVHPASAHHGGPHAYHALHHPMLPPMYHHTPFGFIMPFSAGPPPPGGSYAYPLAPSMVAAHTPPGATAGLAGPPPGPHHPPYVTHQIPPPPSHHISNPPQQGTQSTHQPPLHTAQHSPPQQGTAGTSGPLIPSNTNFTNNASTHLHPHPPPMLAPPPHQHPFTMHYPPPHHIHRYDMQHAPLPPPPHMTSQQSHNTQHHNSNQIQSSQNHPNINSIQQQTPSYPTNTSYPHAPQNTQQNTQHAPNTHYHQPHIHPAPQQQTTQPNMSQSTSTQMTNTHTPSSHSATSIHPQRPPPSTNLSQSQPPPPPLPVTSHMNSIHQPSSNSSNIATSTNPATPHAHPLTSHPNPSPPFPPPQTPPSHHNPATNANTSTTHHTPQSSPIQSHIPHPGLRTPITSHSTLYINPLSSHPPYSNTNNSDAHIQPAADSPRASHHHTPMQIPIPMNAHQIIYATPPLNPNHANQPMHYEPPHHTNVHIRPQPQNRIQSHNGPLIPQHNAIHAPHPPLQPSHSMHASNNPQQTHPHYIPPQPHIYPPFQPFSYINDPSAIHQTRTHHESNTFT